MLLCVGDTVAVVHIGAAIHGPIVTATILDQVLGFVNNDGTPALEPIGLEACDEANPIDCILSIVVGNQPASTFMTVSGTRSPRIDVEG